MINATRSEFDAMLREDFLNFAEAAFNELYPDTKLERNWHHEAIAQLLVQSIGQKTRKYINAPPRTLKSFLVSVAWVAYRLGKEPTHKFICASYSAGTGCSSFQPVPAADEIRILLQSLRNQARKGDRRSTDDYRRGFPVLDLGWCHIDRFRRRYSDFRRSLECESRVVRAHSAGCK